MHNIYTKIYNNHNLSGKIKFNNKSSIVLCKGEHNIPYNEIHEDLYIFLNKYHFLITIKELKNLYLYRHANINRSFIDNEIIKEINNTQSIDVTFIFPYLIHNNIHNIQYYDLFDKNIKNIDIFNKNKKIYINIYNSLFKLKYIELSFNTFENIIKHNKKKHKFMDLKLICIKDIYLFQMISNFSDSEFNDLLHYLISIQNQIYFYFF